MPRKKQLTQESEPKEQISKKQANQLNVQTTKTQTPEALKSDYDVLTSWREHPLPPEKFEKIAADLIAWVEATPDAKRIRDFRRPRNIARSTWDRWLTQSEVLKEANIWAKEAIADNREDLMCSGKYPEKSFLFMQPLYDEDWGSREKEMAKLKDATEQRATTYNIFENPYPTETEEKK